MKRNTSFKTSKLLKVQKSLSQNNPIDVGQESEVIFVENQHKKNHNALAFANISNKKSSGADNWKTFIELNNKHQPIKPKKKYDTNSTIIAGGKVAFGNKSITKPESNKNTNGHNFQKVKRRGTFPESNKHYFTPILDNQKEKLGKSSLNEKCTVNKEKELTKQVAMDCEMVGVEMGVGGNMLARVSIVNAHGNCVYDKYVKPTEPVVAYRTHVSGIRSTDLENAIDFEIVQKEVADILKDRILVGHALKNDLRVLLLTHPKRDMRDTSRFKKFHEGRTPALKKLAKKYLGVTIQDGEHCSVQDALATMQLYKMFRKEWEASIKSKNFKKQVKILETKQNIV